LKGEKVTDKDICTLIENDPWMMEILILAKKLELPDWWIGAGFVRGKVWDHLHGYTTRTPLPDIDVIYFEQYNPSAEEIMSIKRREKMLEEVLMKQRPEIKWSVTNQSRMHLFHNHKPYHTSTEALAQWVETATCVGVTLDNHDHVIITAPRGIDDLIHLILRPTPDNIKDQKTFNNRIYKKQWLTKWPKLRIAI
jgi:uncharacterized protein